MGVLLSKTSLGVVTGMASIAFLGYCIYFDRKRRHHPDFKKNLYERRRRSQDLQESDALPPSQLAVEQYFMEQIHKSEKNILEGNLDRGAENLLQAILICSKPHKLLAVLQESLPMDVFAMLVGKLNDYNARRESANSDCFMTADMMADNGGYCDEPLYQMPNSY